MASVDISSMVYAYFFVGTAVLIGIIRAFHHSVKTIVNMALEPICEDLTKIKYQLYNNGGESMKDAIDRIERDAIELKINQAVIKSRIENQ